MDQGMVGLTGLARWRERSKGATRGESQRRSVGAVVGAAAEKRPFFTGPPTSLTPTGGP